jgi:hypothetical protein
LTFNITFFIIYIREGFELKINFVKFRYIVFPIILIIIIYLLITQRVETSLSPQKTEYVEAENISLRNSITVKPSSIGYARIEDGIQKVRMEISLYEISPPILVVQKGLETEWLLLGVEIDQSNNFIYFPEYETGFVNTGSNYQPKWIDLVLGDNLLTIIPRQDFLFKIRNGKTGFMKVVDDIDMIDVDTIVQDIRTFLPNLSCCIIQNE